MFEDKDLGYELLSNPVLAQAYALDEFESRLNGEYIVADSNTVFNFLLEFGASLQNVHAQKLNEVLRFFYPKRAQISTDLYRHMSDFDYLNMYATPCSCKIQLTLNKKYLVDNAVSYNDNYKLVIIPKYTVFTIGRFKFGIHYDIWLKINKVTNSIIAVWDAEDTNPLYSISQNLITTTLENYSGVELIKLQLPTQQFTRSIVNETLVSRTGFSKTYDFNYKFWAVRVWTILDGNYVELSQSLAKDVYDTSVATAILQVNNESSTFTITIPQIYFTNGLIGKKLYMEVYTTFGELDDDISSISTAAVSATFNLNLVSDTTYSKILKSTPTIDVLPLQTKLTGGGNGYDFDNLRDRVVNQNFYKTVPITPQEIELYFSDNGYTDYNVIKYLDNLTDRIYHAHKTLTDNNGDVFPTTNAYVNISPTLIEGVSSIITNNDGTYTIMPSTLYLYSDGALSATPLTDEEINYFSTLSSLDLIDEFNNNNYTFSPFHLHILNSDRYPKAVSYNLMSCNAQQLTFTESNESIASQIVVYAVSIVHNNAGTGGYTIELAATKSDDILTIPEDQIYIYISTYTAEGHVAGVRATYARTEDNFFIYTFDLKTDYWFNEDGDLNITNLTSANITQPFMIHLEDKYFITSMISKDYLDGSNDNFNYVADLEEELLDTYTVLLRQSVILHLGRSLKNIVSNDINLTTSATEYATWEVDVPLTYTETVYARDENNNIKYSIVDGSVVLEVLHNIGDVSLDDTGQPYLKHKKGTVKYDNSGNPIVKTDRNIVYQVSMMQFDAKIQLSTNPDHITFRNTLSDTLETYFTAVEAVQNQLLERTYIYFRPTKTFGSCKFSIGDQLVKKYNLAIKFSAKYYIKDFVKDNEVLLANIKKVTIDEITTQLETKHICMVSIFETIREKLSDYVVDIDVYGIDGISTLQTLVVAEDDVQPTIATKLVLDRSNNILLEKDIEIDYVVSDSSR